MWCGGVFDVVQCVWYIVAWNGGAVVLRCILFQCVVSCRVVACYLVLCCVFSVLNRFMVHVCVCVLLLFLFRWVEGGLQLSGSVLCQIAGVGFVRFRVYCRSEVCQGRAALG